MLNLITISRKKHFFFLILVKKKHNVIIFYNGNENYVKFSMIFVELKHIYSYKTK